MPNYCTFKPSWFAAYTVLKYSHSFTYLTAMFSGQHLLCRLQDIHPCLQITFSYHKPYQTKDNHTKWNSLTQQTKVMFILLCFTTSQQLCDWTDPGSGLINIRLIIPLHYGKKLKLWHLKLIMHLRLNYWTNIILTVLGNNWQQLT